MAPAQLVGPFPQGADPEIYDRLRRRVLWTMPSGLYLLGSLAGGRRNLMTLSWATQLALDPKLVGVSIEQSALTHELVAAGGCFSLAVLAREDRVLVRKFVRPAADDREARTLAGVPYRDAGATGCPVPLLALGFLDCRVTNRLDCGSHSLFVGEVLDAGFGPSGDPAGAAESHSEGGEVLRMEDTRMSYGG